MPRISIMKYSVRTAAVAFVIANLLSVANASYLHRGTGLYVDQPTRATVDNFDRKETNSLSRSMVLASNLPWPAPVGHRQPRQSDLPRYHGPSAEERAQQKIDHDLNQKLIICRGC
jgi:hypothetical protein